MRVEPIIDQLAHEGLRSLGVVDVAGAVLKPQDLPGLGQMRQQRIVAGILGMMGIEAMHRPTSLAVLLGAAERRSSNLIFQCTT